MARSTKTSRPKGKASPIRRKVHPQEALRARLDLLLVDLDRFLPSTRGAIQNGKGPLPRLLILAFPARRRVPGERRPLRLVDGVSSTQPLRGRRSWRNNRESQTSTASEAVHALEEIDTSSRSPPPSALDSTLESLMNQTSDQEKKNAPPHLDSSMSSFFLHPEKSSQKQQHFTTAEITRPTWLAHEATLCQSLGEQSQLLPNQFWIPGPASHLIPSLIGLPNDRIWQPQQGLFVQDLRLAPQVPSDTTQKGSPITKMFMANSPSTRWSEPPFHFQHDTSQAVSEPHHDTSAFNNDAPYTHDNDSSTDSHIPSLTSESSSSQTHSPPSDSFGNYSPTSPSERSQPQAHIVPSNAPQGGEEERLGGDDDVEKLALEDEEWKCWLNFDTDPDRAA